MPFNYIMCEEQCLKDFYRTAFHISLVSTAISVLISLYMIHMHLTHFSKPQLQSKIVVILFMAPIYALNSIASLLFPHIAAYLELIRDIYLAFLLFTFFYLIFSYIAFDPISVITHILLSQGCIQDDLVYLTMLSYKQYITHLWPFNHCTKDYQLTTKAKAKYFTYRCKKFVL